MNDEEQLTRQQRTMNSPLIYRDQIDSTSPAKTTPPTIKRLIWDEMQKKKKKVNSRPLFQL